MAVSAEVVRYRVTVGIFFLVVAVIFAAAVAVEMVETDENGGSGFLIRPRTPPTEQDLASLRADLASPDPQTRIRAMATLLARGDAEMKTRIFGALSDPHPSVRIYGVSQIAAMDTAYLPHVMPLLADADGSVRDAAVSALMRAPSVAAPYLAGYVASSDTAVALAAWRLVGPAWTADPISTRQTVAVALQGSNAGIRREAAAFAMTLPAEEQAFFRPYLDRLPPETAAAPPG